MDTIEVDFSISHPVKKLWLALSGIVSEMPF
jgi:hypothetical protein